MPVIEDFLSWHSTMDEHLTANHSYNMSLPGSGWSPRGGRCGPFTCTCKHSISKPTSLKLVKLWFLVMKSTQGVRLIIKILILHLYMYICSPLLSSYSYNNHLFIICKNSPLLHCPTIPLLLRSQHNYQYIQTFCNKTLNYIDRCVYTITFTPPVPYTCTHVPGSNL